MSEKTKYTLHKIARLFGVKSRYCAWEFGECNNTIARRHKINGNVQMRLWAVGQQGHTQDFWCNFGDGWAELFILKNAWNMETLLKDEELFVLTKKQFADVYRYLTMASFYREDEKGMMLVRTTSIRLKPFLRKYLREQEDGKK